MCPTVKFHIDFDHEVYFAYDLIKNTDFRLPFSERFIQKIKPLNKGTAFQVLRNRLKSKFKEPLLKKDLKNT